MEPVNATASYQDGAVEVWGPIQAVAACQEAVAHAVGCAPDDVKVNVTFLGGSFGRKIVPDYVVQAVHVSKAVGRPVKLIRSREEDMQHDVYRPNAGGRVRAVVDAAGYPLAVHARVAGQSLFNATRKSWLEHTPDGAWDESMVDGLYNQSYRLPNFLVETIDTPLPVPVYFMRSVGSTAAVFFWESFISELAQRAKIDQYAYRRNLLADDPLALRVLDAVAQASGWGTRGAARHVPGHLLQLLHRPRRAVQNLRRGGRGARARRRTVRDQAHLLRRRSGPGGEPEHAEGADRGRHRVRAHQHAQEHDHLLQRRRRPVQLLRLQSAAHGRDAGDRVDHPAERPSASRVRRGGPGAGRARGRAGPAARHRPAARRHAVPRRCLRGRGPPTRMRGAERTTNTRCTHGKAAQHVGEILRQWKAGRIRRTGGRPAAVGGARASRPHREQVRLRHRRLRRLHHACRRRSDSEPASCRS